MIELRFLLAIVWLAIACNNNTGKELIDMIDPDRLYENMLYAYTPPVATPGPPTLTSAVGKQMDHPDKDTITVSIGTADSTENACVKLSWLVSGYPDGVYVGNTMLIADYVPDTSYKVPDHFPENVTIYISAWTGNVSDGDTIWSNDPNWTTCI